MEENLTPETQIDTQEAESADMQKAKAKNSPLKIALNVIYYVILSAVILLAVFFMVMTFTAKNGVSNIFGYMVSSVQSGSMSGTFEQGDIIVVKQCQKQDIQKEDIIMFRYLDPQSGKTVLVTHRVIEIREDGKFITQGDVARRQNSIDKVEYVSYGDVLGEYTNVKLVGVGKVIDFLKSPTGFFCCILIPVFLFLFYQIYVFIKTLVEANALSKQKETNDKARELAEQMFLEMQQQAATEEVATQSADESLAETDKTEE